MKDIIVYFRHALNVLFMVVALFRQDRYQEFLEAGQDALQDRRNPEAMVHLGHAILAQRVTVPSERIRSIVMPSHMKNRIAVVSQVGEYAMPRHLPGLYAQRVRVQRLHVGAKNQTADEIVRDGGKYPGLDISIRYPFDGRLTAKIMFANIKKRQIYWTINDRTSGLESNWQDLRSSYAVASIMNWALTEGECLPAAKHGIKSHQDYLQALNLRLFAVFAYMAK